MKNRVMVIVPTRGRPDSALELTKELTATSVTSDVVFGIDDDDVRGQEYFDILRPRRASVIMGPRGGMNATLNDIAVKSAPHYDYLAFMGDDHRPRTPGWDQALIDSITGFDYGIAYGNDMIQGENLPTAVLLDAKIVRVLGFMAPPAMRHLYLDNFWKDLGTELGTLRYNPGVIIEHMHFSVGKSAADELYQEVNSSAMYDADAAAYENYLKGNFDKDLKKLRG